MKQNDLYLHCDFHVHTRYSPCASPEMLPNSIVVKAREQGVKYLGLSDHVFAFTDPSILKHARQDCPPCDGYPEVFFGCEADVLSVGRTTVTRDMIDTLDYIMVAANHFTTDLQKTVDMPLSDDPVTVGRHFLEMFNYAATLDYADVIVHPFFVMPGPFDVSAIYTLTEKDLIPGIEAAAAHGVAVEISRRSTTPDHIGFLTPFYRLCKEAGVKFSVGSDSHTLDAVGRTDVLTPLIRELGLQDDDLWIPKKNGGKID
jgi:histidinol phosphatase-like PHP family hydrolase